MKNSPLTLRVEGDGTCDTDDGAANLAVRGVARTRTVTFTQVFLDPPAILQAFEVSTDGGVYGAGLFGSPYTFANSFKYRTTLAPGTYLTAGNTGSHIAAALSGVGATKPGSTVSAVGTLDSTDPVAPNYIEVRNLFHMLGVEILAGADHSPNFNSTVDVSGLTVFGETRQTIFNLTGSGMVVTSAVLETILNF